MTRKLAAAALAAAFASPALAGPPAIGGCPVFPWNNHWNTRVDHLPLHPSSATWVNSVGPAGKLHPDWGIAETYYGIPYVVVPGTQPPVPIAYTEAGDESDPGPFPIPPDAPIEGGSDAPADSDRHVIVIENASCRLYELYNAFPINGGQSWQAYSGAKFDFASNASRPLGWTSADAAGLAIFPGLVRYEEVAAGEIAHAIRFTASLIWGREGTAGKWLWPARHWSGLSTDSTRPPMGARFRLKASFDISPYHPQTQVILRAMKKYGMILADAGSNWYFQGTSNVNWPATVLTQLKSISGSNFEVVDSSRLKVHEDSGEAIPRAAVPTDLNAEGRSDILWRNDETGQVYRMLMNGAAIAGAAMAYVEPNLQWKVVGEGDFDGNGTTDLLWKNDATGQVAMVRLAYTGLPNAVNVFYNEPNIAWKIVATPDLNGDGRNDVLWWNMNTGQVFAMLMNGAAILAQGMVFHEPDTQWKIVATGDFAPSGKQDGLVWRNSSTGQVYLMTVSYSPASGFGQSGALVYVEPDAGWRIVTANDFNGDGRSDLLWRHQATGRVYVMLMNGPAVAGGGFAYHEPNTDWKLVAAGDYDGDGKADLLFRNDTTGQVFMALMNGLAVASGATVYVEPNTAWKVLGPAAYAQ